jgi:hypothetical protein
LRRLRLVFVLSLFVMAGVFIATVYFIPSVQRPPQSRSAKVIRMADEWILQADISNRESRDIEYTIFVTVDGAVHKDSAVVKPEKTYTYIYRINRQHIKEGKVTYALYEDGKTEPVEQTTYYVD